MEYAEYPMQAAMFVSSHSQSTASATSCGSTEALEQGNPGQMEIAEQIANLGQMDPPGEMNIVESSDSDCLRR